MRQARVLRRKAGPTRAFAGMPGPLWLKMRNQMVGTIADEIGTAHPLQGCTQHRPIVRVVITQKCRVQATDLQTFRNRDSFTGARDFP